MARSSATSVRISSSGGSSSGGSSGGDGHTHSNLEDLEKISISGTEIKVDGGDASVAYATNAASAATAQNLSTSSSDWTKILRKDIADTAAEVITFAKGLIATLKSYFNGGIEVSGGTATDTLAVSSTATVSGKVTANGGLEVTGNTKLNNDLSVSGDTYMRGDLNVDGVTTLDDTVNINDDLNLDGDLKVAAGNTATFGDTATDDCTRIEDGTIETKNLTVTGHAHFFELIIDKIKAVGGAVLFSAADGFEVARVDPVNITTGTVIPASQAATYYANGMLGYKLYWIATDTAGKATTNGRRILQCQQQILVESRHLCKFQSGRGGSGRGRD